MAELSTQEKNVLYAGRTEIMLNTLRIYGNASATGNPTPEKKFEALMAAVDRAAESDNRLSAEQKKQVAEEWKATLTEKSTKTDGSRDYAGVLSFADDKEIQAAVKGEIPEIPNEVIEALERDISDPKVPSPEGAALLMEQIQCAAIGADQGIPPEELKRRQDELAGLNKLFETKAQQAIGADDKPMIDYAKGQTMTGLLDSKTPKAAGAEVEAPAKDEEKPAKTANHKKEGDEKEGPGGLMGAFGPMLANLLSSPAGALMALFVMIMALTGKLGEGLGGMLGTGGGQKENGPQFNESRGVIDPKTVAAVGTEQSTRTAGEKREIGGVQTEAFHVDRQLTTQNGAKVDETVHLYMDKGGRVCGVSCDRVINGKLVEGKVKELEHPIQLMQKDGAYVVAGNSRLSTMINQESADLQNQTQEAKGKVLALATQVQPGLTRDAALSNGTGPAVEQGLKYYFKRT